MAMAGQLELAESCRKKQDFDRALRIVYSHMELCSNDPDAFNELGIIYRDLARTGGIADSERWLRKAVEANPSPRHLVNLGITLLHQAKWRDGWRFFSARKDVFNWRRARKRVAFWEGQPLAGKRLLVFQEQGLGDLMQFARFIQWLKELGPEITIHCDPQLHPLLQGSAARLRIDNVISKPEVEEAYDFQVPQMSLPLLLKMNGTAIEEVPYLVVPGDTPPVIAAPNPEGGATRVAIVWACNEDSDNYKARSCPITEFGPVAESGFELFSVQKEVSDQDAAVLKKLGITDLKADLTDMARTASVLQSVRALLTVDTAVAHLAGAMNIDTVLMLHFAADWRWHNDRHTSSWYPRVRIVRQKTAGHWSDVIEDAVAMLRGLE